MSKKDGKKKAGNGKDKDRTKGQAPKDAETNGEQTQEKSLSKAEMRAKARPFFERAAEVAKAGNWDYAIEMYLEGIRRDPTEIEAGHKKLREAALQRKMRGGKPAGFFEARKHKPSKDPLVGLINAEWMMSRDPANLMYWRQIIAAARAGEWPEILAWAVGAMFDINTKAAKPSKEIYLQARDVFVDLKKYSEAVQACAKALELTPDDGALQNSMRDLSAQETIQRGQFDQEGDFTKSVKDLDGQLETVKKEMVSVDAGFLADQLEKARNAYEADSSVPGKIMALVEALERIATVTEDEGYEHEAIAVLDKAHKDLGTYSFRMRLGDIKMRQMKRRHQKLLKDGDKEAAAKHAKEQLDFELAEYTERAANYPTDLSLKYEVGVRQYIRGQYDEAIASLQQARRDPRNRRKSMNTLGLSFFKKGWHREAAETFEQALEGDLSEARQKDLRYNLGNVYEAMEENSKALEQYSIVAQIDFNFKDVRKRIENLRAKGA